ncbi:MAG: hypothetical protein QHG99_02570 [Methanomicrobiales archaeon]|nr:hypothetical protein [Methanomicrobiales archaeon]
MPFAVSDLSRFEIPVEMQEEPLEKDQVQQEEDDEGKTRIIVNRHPLISRYAKEEDPAAPSPAPRGQDEIQFKPGYGGWDESDQTSHINEGVEVALSH